MQDVAWQGLAGARRGPLARPPARWPATRPHNKGLPAQELKLRQLRLLTHNNIFLHKWTMKPRSHL